jgi:hypothetical protein
LIVLNLRGMRDSIKVLLPIFLGFFVTHAIRIAAGIGFHVDRLPTLLPDETERLAQQFGWIFVASLFLRAYSRSHSLLAYSFAKARRLAR